MSKTWFSAERRKKVPLALRRCRTYTYMHYIYMIYIYDIYIYISTIYIYIYMIYIPLSLVKSHVTGAGDQWRWCPASRYQRAWAEHDWFGALHRHCGSGHLGASLEELLTSLLLEWGIQYYTVVYSIFVYVCLILIMRIYVCIYIYM